MSNQSIDRTYHKLLIVMLKVLPAIMAGSYIVKYISTIYGLGIHVLAHHLGMVVAPLLFMYVASFVFRFCVFHRVFMHYVMLKELIVTVHWYDPSSLNYWYTTLLNRLLIVIVIIYYAYKLYKKRRPSN